MSQLPEKNSVMAQYLRFCANPLRDDEQLMREYWQLTENPNITTIAFHKPEVLMVGTKPVIIQHVGCSFEIGEFIFFLIRRRVEKYWEVDFRFWNATNPIEMVDQASQAVLAVYIHPHIMLSNDCSELDCQHGKLCISQGQFEIYQYMRKGQIHFAVQRLFEVLHVYPTGSTYHDVTSWPILEENDD